MAVPEQKEKEPLKYLGFIVIAVACGTKCVGKAYEFAKEKTGSWKAHVVAVEKKVCTIVAPVYHKLEGKPYEILVCVDKKVDFVACTVDCLVPKKVKEATCKVVEIAKQIPEFVICVVSEVHKSGLIETSKVYYAKCQPIAEEWIYFTWKLFLKLPCSAEAVHCVAPYGLSLAEKFNSVIFALKEKQLPIVCYVPFLPVKKIEAVIKKDTY